MTAAPTAAASIPGPARRGAGPAMARFSLRLVAGSTRWIAPAVVYAFGALLVLANPGTQRGNAVFFFPLHEIVTCWIAVIVGNVDDDGHRELCTAAVGSPGRLVAARAGAAGVVAVVLAVVATVGSAALVAGRAEPVGTVAVVLALQLAAGFLGVGIGALLHRPLVPTVGVSVLVAGVALLVGIATPPVTRTLRAVNDGSDVAAFGLLGVAALLGLGAVALAAALTDRAVR